MTAWNFLLVGAGGCIGSMARYLVVTSVDRKFNALFPYGTLAVNLIGSFILGFLLAWLSNKSETSALQWKLLLGGGFCGGFTTFSAFAVENFNLLSDKFYATSLIYMAASLLAGLLAVWAGLVLGRTVL